jgi:hypothetical protein
MQADGADLRRGALNLLAGCAGARAGESLLIVREPEDEDFFDPALVDALAREAERYGLTVTLREVPFDPEAAALPEELAEAVARAAHTLFLARLGDQLRFQAMPAGSRAVVSYVLDREGLASCFGTAPYADFLALKRAFDALWASAAQIRITCRRGTDLQGRSVSGAGAHPADTSVRRFPMQIFAPVPAAAFSGRVAVAHMLCGTGSRYYQPFGFRLDAPLSAVIAGGRLLRFEGDAATVARAQAHHADIAGRYGIDGGFVHSWHAGIHPGCAFTRPAHGHYERWSGSAFGNPRILHFHTCGAYAPGEICWNVIDPTVTADGVMVYDAGRIIPEAVPGMQAILAGSPHLATLFAQPDRRIGLDD